MNTSFQCSMRRPTKVIRLDEQGESLFAVRGDRGSLGGLSSCRGRIGKARELHLQSVEAFSQRLEACLQTLEVRPQGLEVDHHEPEVRLQNVQRLPAALEVRLRGLELHLHESEVRLSELEVHLQELEMRLQGLGKRLRGFRRAFFYETAPLGLHRDRSLHRAALHLGFAEPECDLGRHPGAR